MNGPLMNPVRKDWALPSEQKGDPSSLFFFPVSARPVNSPVNKRDTEVRRGMGMPRRGIGGPSGHPTASPWAAAEVSLALSQEPALRLLSLGTACKRRDQRLLDCPAILLWGLPQRPLS